MPDPASTATQTSGALALDTDPVHLAATGRATPIHAFGFDPAAFEAYIAEHCSDADPGRLVMVEHSPVDWGMWECHRAGDEVVIVIGGVARFIQEIDGEPSSRRLETGQAIINPAGVWHTADVEEPFSAVYLTPCPGTEHRPR